MAAYLDDLSNDLWSVTELRPSKLNGGQVLSQIKETQDQSQIFYVYFYYICIFLVYILLDQQSRRAGY